MRVVVLTDDVVGCAGVVGEVGKEEGPRGTGEDEVRDLPYQCPPFRHGAHGAHAPAYAWELECAWWFGEGLVQGVFVDCAVASRSCQQVENVATVRGRSPSSVNVVPVRTPARIHAPWRCSPWRQQARSGRRLPPVPDRERAVNG